MICELKKIIKVALTIVLIGSIYGCSIHEDNRVEQAIFTEEDLLVLKQFENKTLKVGYPQGHEINFVKSITTIIQEELSIKLEFVEYATFEDLQEAAGRGEVDILTNLVEETEGFEWVSILTLPARYLITNRNSPLGDISNLSKSKIGFVAGTPICDDFLNVIWSNEFETHFFASATDALDALENQELDVVITRTEITLVELIARPDLQIESQARSKIVSVNLTAIDEEILQGLKVLEKMMDSPRAELFGERIREARDNGAIEYFVDYMQETYPDAVERYEAFEIGHHNKNFPYSYINSDGNWAGIYVELLELFQAVTGIKYLHHDNEHFDLHEGFDAHYTFDRLEANDIKFVFAACHMPDSADIVAVGEDAQVLDRIITIKKHGNEQVVNRALANIRFGLTSSMKETAEELGLGRASEENVIVFSEYDLAAEALMNNEIDILIGRESVLSYYQNVRGNARIVQANFINRLGVHSILGNVENEELNMMMADTQRFFFLMYPDGQALRWARQAINYQSAYIELHNQRQAMYLAFGGLIVSFGVFIFIKREKEHRKLKKVAKLDRLTGLWNKEAYEEKCMELIKNNSESLGAFCFIDLDNLKTVNDTYGHNAGDAMLIRFAEFLKTLENKETVCFRIAGDEFGVFRIGLEDEAEITDMIQELKQKLDFSIENTEIRLPIKYSGGVSIYNKHSKKFSVLKHSADIAMYRAKSDKVLREFSDILIFNGDFEDNFLTHR